jgi:small subunit ribosomal protein S4
MGGIRKPRKKYVAPGHPWQKTRLAEELNFVGEYGLRNKRELWRHRTALARFRGTARDLLALPDEERGVRESQLLGRLNRLSLLKSESRLDDVLGLTMRDILERRLQTQVLRQGLAKSVYHARQLVVHGHIALDGRRVTSPGMLLYRGQESNLSYSPGSPYRQKGHPEIPTGKTVAAPSKAPEPGPTPEVVPVKIPKVRDIKEVTIEDTEVDEDEELDADEVGSSDDEEQPKNNDSGGAEK